MHNSTMFYTYTKKIFGTFSLMSNTTCLTYTLNLTGITNVLKIYFRYVKFYTGKTSCYLKNKQLKFK